MTIREIIKHYIGYQHDFEQKAMVRIIRRDLLGCVTEVKLVPVERIHNGTLVIDDQEITMAKWEKA